MKVKLKPYNKGLIMKIKVRFKPCAVKKLETLWGADDIVVKIAKRRGVEIIEVEYNNGSHYYFIDDLIFKRDMFFVIKE